MTLNQTICPSHIALHTVKPGEIGTLALVFEKSATDLKFKSNPTFLGCKNTVHIASFNVRTLNRTDQLRELTASAAERNIQEHKSYHSELEIQYYNTSNGWTFVSISAWKNSVKAVTGGVGMLFSPRAPKSQNSIEKIQPRIMCALSNGNPCSTIISCFSPTNASGETNFINFDNEQSSLVRSILTHNVLIIRGGMNAQIDKDETNKFCIHRNGEYLTDFSLENRQTCLYTKFQKRRENYGPTPIQIMLKHG